MNLHLLIRKLAGRPTCARHQSSRIASRARIINIGGPNSRIEIGAHSIVEGELLVFPHGGQITIGKWCYINAGSRLWSDASISIGNRVLISHGVNVFDNRTHPISPIARHQHFREIAEKGHPLKIDLGGLPIVIEDDAWIAAGAMVLRGTRVGHGAIVAAGAIVVHDVPPFSIVAGNPARVVRELSAEERTAVLDTMHSEKGHQVASCL
jgi:acetyltransferase-like isoleucine patch superfamily enzyme